MKRHRDNRRDSRRDNRRDNRDYTRDDNRDDNRHDSIRNGISDNTHDNGPDSWHDSGRDHLIGRWDDDTRDRRRYGSLRPTTGQGVLWLLGATALWHFCLWPLLHYHFPHYAFPLLNAEGWACLARLADLVGGLGGLP